MKKASILLGIVLVLMVSCTNKPLINFVNPFIGTGGHGHTYPGPGLPFGMIQIGPDTRLDGWDGCSGYHYSDSVVYGFSHTHLSGTGAIDYGDILLMPTTGPLQLDNGAKSGHHEGYASSFSHNRETASPGYYSVLLEDYNIFAELTATTRTGFHRYVFPETEQAHIILDLEHRDYVTESFVRFVSDTEIEGLRRSRNWARDQYVYFVARFSKPFQSFGISKDGIKSDGLEYGEGQRLKAWMSFETKAGEEIKVKVGISAVDVAGARENLKSESPGWDFRAVQTSAEKAWEDELGKIRVNGGSEAQRRTFYTAMYHAFLNPNIYMDVDGRYRGRDLEIHTAEAMNYYTLFSLWDTFRALHPLFTILEPERTNDFIKTFLLQYKQGGALPVWELSANETGTMIGYHAVPVIVDAWVKGLRGYDTQLALKAMKHSAQLNGEGLEFYREMGFIPTDQEVESVAKTLEYAYDDWCIAMMAKILGDTTGYEEYIRRAQYYKNVFDPESRFFRGRVNGGWYAPFDPFEVNFNYTEANAWQYRYFVPQDISGLMELLGGETGFVEALDDLFMASPEIAGREQPDISGMIGQYAHGNEPSHHIAYLYPFAGAPWKTQKWTRRIMDEMYTDKPDGLSGNEDAGQMSAWYIFSALGFYPVTPGLDYYTIGTPLFKEAGIALPGGKRFVIRAKKLSQKNFYIQSAKLNGKVFTNAFIDHASIMAGGELEFMMGPEPNKAWGSQKENRPVAGIRDHLIQPAPYYKGGKITFKDQLDISIAGVGATDIYYTLDGSDPDAFSKTFSKPIPITESTHLKAVARNENNEKSFIVSGTFNKISSEMSIRLFTEYSSLYTGGGDLALIDFIQGNQNFRSGAWQGYEAENVEAIVDMGSIKTVQLVAIGFLQNQRSWIFMPESVDFYVSSDGTSFRKVGTVNNSIPADAEGTVLKKFSVTFPAIRARYVRVVAGNRKTCPDWHPGAGGRAWIFADEIIIK